MIVQFRSQISKIHHTECYHESFFRQIAMAKTSNLLPFLNLLTKLGVTTKHTPQCFSTAVFCITISFFLTIGVIITELKVTPDYFGSINQPVETAYS